MPEESNNDTNTPATPVAVPDNVAAPDNVAPHCALVAAETVVLADTGLNDVVTFPASVDEPLAETLTDPDDNPETGPEPEGQTGSTNGLRHNCGASPITLIVALGAVT